MSNFKDVFSDVFNRAFEDLSSFTGGPISGFPGLGPLPWFMGSTNEQRQQQRFDSSPDSDSYSPHPRSENESHHWRRDQRRDNFPDSPSPMGTGPHFFSGFTNDTPGGFSHCHVRQHDDFVRSAQNAHAQMHAQATGATPHRRHPSAAAFSGAPTTATRPSHARESASYRRPEPNAPYSSTRTSAQYRSSNPAHRNTERAPEVRGDRSTTRLHPTSPLEPMAGSGTSRPSRSTGVTGYATEGGGQHGSSSAAASDPANPGNNSRPPKRATPKALSPPVILCRDADENCAVCLEEFVQGCPVLRLPCLHQFHSPQCSDWILEHQSCPVCKLDLHPSHVHRKLRLRVHEVEQMSVKELQYVCYYVGILDQLEGAIEKSDVVNVIMASRLVTVICPPAEDLRSYSVKDLRQLTNTLGVDTKTCLDKDDLIKQLLKQHFVVVDTEVTSPK